MIPDPLHSSAARGAVAGLRRAAAVVSFLLLLFVVLSGCNDNGTTKPGDNNPPPPSDQARPDFHLLDVNPHSALHDSLISPRDYLGKVSAWYFGHST